MDDAETDADGTDATSGGPDRVDYGPLRAALDGFDGYLLDADGEDSNQRYLSGFAAPDPFVTLWTPGGTHLLVSSLEYGRARDEADAATVARFADYDYRSRAAERGPHAGRALTVAAWLADRDADAVRVPERFPLGVADRLRDRDVTVETDPDDSVETVRARKTPTEVDHVRAAQRANEAAMAAAADLLRAATPDDEGVLRHDGAALTSERVRGEIEGTLLDHGCGLDETIVACGADAADPHDRGSGPLRAGEAIVVDVFPYDKTTGYYADMTRTFAVGDPGERIREWHALTDEARRAALDVLEPGVTGAAVHDAVCDVYEDAGLPTLRADPRTGTGFIHSTGHGIGLDVHELPRLSPDGGELRPGHVVTVEPGLYDPAVGGVRIEDLVVVTEDGHENLTEYPVDLTPRATSRST
ncbi:MAG: M24 family metallopeptidase [Haloferacaceae archaeon]